MHNRLFQDNKDGKQDYVGTNLETFSEHEKEGEGLQSMGKGLDVSEEKTGVCWASTQEKGGGADRIVTNKKRWSRFQKKETRKI